MSAFTNTDTANVPAIGSMVKIVGIVAKPELNGMLGRVCSKANENGRVVVEVLQNSKKLMLQPKNLTMVPTNPGDSFITGADGKSFPLFKPPATPTAPASPLTPSTVAPTAPAAAPPPRPPDTVKKVPRPPLSPYMSFAEERRPAIHQANPNFTFGEVGKALGDAWRKLSDAQRAEYQSTEPVTAEMEGYPTEAVKNVFDATTQAELMPPQRKEMQKLLKALPVTKQLFCEVGQAARRAQSNTTTVDKSAFKRQLEWFTWGLFAEWDAALWDNVLLAGGAVLASLLPPAPGYTRMKPLGNDGGQSWCEFDLYWGRMRRSPSDEPDRTLEQYFRTTHWPTSDVDLFIYGLDAEAAQAKLLTILSTLQRSLVRKHGVQNEVYFIKTQNTVTLGCGQLGRTVQVILRLYESKEIILNGFDIDCCCVGYDGTNTLITPRCIAALRTRVNTINLQIRGEAYECRLLKYVERGFAIGIPSLDKSKSDREHLAFELKPGWNDYDELDGEGWSKWGDSAGLERLLMAENLARLQNGIIERPFPGRQRKGTGRERELHMKIVPYPNSFGPVRDSYVSHDKAGNPIWPATTKLEAIKRGEDKFAVRWAEGNMPRKPMTWEAWSESACIGYAERKARYGYDPDYYKKQREEREAKEAAKRAAEIEEAIQERGAEERHAKEQALAETAAIRQAAAEKEVEFKRAKKEQEAKARQAAMEKKLAETKLAKAREDKEKIEMRAEEEKNRAEVELARVQEAKQQLEQAVDEKLCCICLDEDKSVMFEPCRHVSVCASCSAHIRICPLCKTVATRKVSVYL